MDRLAAQIAEEGQPLLYSRKPLVAQAAGAAVLATTGRGIAVLPTGSGKTLLAALPFALGLLPCRQMIFMTPLRSLTGAQAATLRSGIDGAIAARRLGLPWRVAEQSGQNPEDPEFTASAVVCTFDQALSSALRIAYSLSSGRRTVNAGAVLTSYLVADELHLFPRDQALTTLLWLLTHRPDLPFLLMTATLTRPVIEGLAQVLRASVLPALAEADRARLGLSERRRRVVWQPHPLDAAAIVAAAHGHEQVLVVVNTVARAIELGQALRHQLGPERVLVLHSRYYPRDRAEIEATARAALGRDPAGRRPCILVATQVVEVGLDLSGDLLLTELAPANALVQRWGRCARWGGHGRVMVAPPATERAWPYAAEPGGDELVARTRAWLMANATGDGLLMGDAEERALLEAVHAADDQRWLDGLPAALAALGSRIGEVMADGQYSAAGELIRAADSRLVLVHGRPEELARPFTCQGFTLASGTLRQVLAPEPAAPAGDNDEEVELVSFDLPEAPGWRLKVPIWSVTETGQAHAEEPAGWREATVADLRTEPLFALQPALASYDPALGLSLGAAAIGPVSAVFWAAPAAAEAASRRTFGRYRRETFAEHAGRMLALLDDHPALWPTIAPVADRIEVWCGWPPGLLRRLTRAAIVLHDAGKLTVAWQQAIVDYQRAHCRPVQPWLVHSDEPPPGQARHPWQPPPHALSGAAHADLVGAAFDREVAHWRQASRLAGTQVRPSAVLLHAIATHHAPRITRAAISEAERLSQRACREIALCLGDHGLPVLIAPAEPHRPLLERMVAQRSQHLAGPCREALALAVVTRLLRLADGWSQAATKEGGDD